MKCKGDHSESLEEKPNIQTKTANPEPTQEEIHASYVKRVNKRIDKLTPELSKFIEDDKLTQFRQELIQWLNEGKNLSEDDFEDVVAFTDKLFKLLDILSNTPRINHHSLKKLELDLEQLKLKLPPTTIGRVLLGILAAFILTIPALIETFLLPISLPLYYVTKLDFPYKITRELGSFSSRMFRSPLYPAFKIIEEIYEKFDEKVEKVGLFYSK